MGQKIRLYGQDKLMVTLGKIKILEELQAKRLSQKEAASRLGLSTRHVRRLLRRYSLSGAAGIIDGRSNNKGRPRLEGYVKSAVKSLVSEIYFDFAPTFLMEKLWDEHNIKVSRETLRAWLTEWGYHTPRKYKHRKLHPLRNSRDSIGELIQIDGSHHEWFGEGNGKFCLLVAIDDASSAILGLHFRETESTDAYFGLLRKYIKDNGVPQTLYCDRHSVFKNNLHDGETQFQRAAKALSIEIIYARSPEAKGRVERANKTLQDRLIKELRLRSIKDITSANKFIPEYIKMHNKKFAKEPRCPANKHLRLTDEQAKKVDAVLCKQYQKRLSKNDIVSHRGYNYQILDATLTARQRGVTLCEFEDEIKILSATRELKFEVFRKNNNNPNKLLNRKELDQYLDRLWLLSKRKGDNSLHPDK